MKKFQKLLICLLLVFSLSAGIFVTGAYAATTYYLTVGEDCGHQTVYSFNGTITDANLIYADGTFVPGLSYDHDSSSIFVSGIPTKAGVYTLAGHATTESGTADWAFVLDVADGDPVVTPVKPFITKNPTDETTEVGGSAIFIARADGATKIEWLFTEPTSDREYTVAEALKLVGGFNYEGINEETLVISQLPEKFNGWSVECVFSNSAGETKSVPAKLTVNKKPPQAPKITVQPSGSEAEIGKSCTLSVQATGQVDATLNYQWYSSSTPGTASLSPIMGATTPSYIPPQTEGTVYYTVGVWCTSKYGDSDKTYSSPAAVIYKPAATPAPTATPAPSVAPTTVPGPDPGKKETHNSETDAGLILIISLLLLGGLGGAIYYILYRKKSAKVNDEEVNFFSLFENHENEAQSTNKPSSWICRCGTVNTGYFCTQCGNPKPDDVSCVSCGWKPNDSNNPPRFCPNCGVPFGQLR